MEIITSYMDAEAIKFRQHETTFLADLKDKIKTNGPVIGEEIKNWILTHKLLTVAMLGVTSLAMFLQSVIVFQVFTIAHLLIKSHLTFHHHHGHSFVRLFKLIRLIFWPFYVLHKVLSILLWPFTNAVHLLRNAIYDIFLKPIYQYVNLVRGDFHTIFSDELHYYSDLFSVMKMIEDGK